MRYNLSVNQYGFLKYKEKNPHSNLNIIDAIILNWMKCLINEWEDIEKIEWNGNTFYWIAYNKLLSELPGLGIREKDGVYNRLKKGLLKEKLLQKFVNKKDNNKTYFRLTTLGHATVTSKTIDRNPTSQPTDRHTDGKPYNNNTINNITKDERELSHFDYFKSSFPNEYEKLNNNEFKRIFNVEEFKQGFNNKMLIENFPKNKTIYPRLQNFCRGWIKNQNENDRPAPSNFRPCS